MVRQEVRSRGMKEVAHHVEISIRFFTRRGFFVVVRHPKLLKREVEDCAVEKTMI